MVTGGTGLIGSRLVPLLREKGYRTHIVSRSASKDPDVFHWNVQRGMLEREALEGVNHIIHLAGAGLAEKRWTKKRKQEIIDSRVQSAKLLYDSVERWGINLQTFISPSGIDYYDDFGDQAIKEDMNPGDDFLSHVCVQWEEASKQFNTLNARTIQLRVGLVLSPEGGMLKEVLQPLKFGVAPYFGSGRQLYSWVHIDDVCRAFIFALENDRLSGPFNIVAGNPVTNKSFIRTLKKAAGKPALTFGVPAFALRLVFGELADAVLGSANISVEKIKDRGFELRFDRLELALKHLFGRQTLPAQ